MQDGPHSAQGAVAIIATFDCITSGLAKALEKHFAEVVTIESDDFDFGRSSEKLKIDQNCLGRISTVVNIGEVGVTTSLRSVTPIDFAMEVSHVLKAVVVGTKFGIRILSKAGGGSIINVICGAGLAAAAEDNLVLQAVRGAATNLSRSAALHAGKSGTRVRVNSIFLPGLPPARIEDSTLVGTIVYLGSSDADFVTGLELVLREGASA